MDFEENVEYEQLNIEQLKEERDKNEESKNQIVGSLNELIGDIPKELQNIEIVDLKIGNLNTEIEKFNERKKSLDDEGQRLKQNKASLETAKKLLSEKEEGARRTLGTAERKLLQGLEKYSFKDKEALEIYLPKVSQIKEEEKKWEEYDRAIERLEYDIDIIKKSTEDIDQIVDEELKDKYTTAQSSFEEEQRSLTDNEIIIENLTKLKDKVDECDAEIKELEDTHLSLINLSNAFNGREGSQRVGLETFALRKMFELVLAAANKRLNMMTRRYQLEIKSETKGAAQHEPRYICQ